MKKETAVNLNDLGTFASMDAVYAAYPSGGVKGNFIVVGGNTMYWDEDTMRWQLQSGGSDDDLEVNGTLTADEVVMKDGFRTSDFVDDTQGGALRKENGQWVLSVDDINIRSGNRFRGQSSFTSFVFCRYATQPATPQNGDFDHPLPDGMLWHDTIPQGTETIWISSRIFTSDGLAPQQSVWSTPRKLMDDETTDFELSNAQLDEIPEDPSDSNRGTLWFDPSVHTADWTSMNWMAFATKSYDANGNVSYGTWTKVPIKGERGADGPGFENVFYRTKKLIAPVPIVTAGTAFQNDDYKPGVANRTTCQGESGMFTDNPKGVDNTWRYEWMMTRKKKNGVWQNFINSGLPNNPVLFATFSEEHDVYISENGTWVIDGVDTGIRAAGEGISPEGRVDYYEESDIPAGVSGKTSLEGITSDATVEKTVGKCWIVDDSGFIYLYLGGESENWENHWKELGEFKGERGEDGVSSYMYLAWATNVSFTDDNPPQVDVVTGFTTDPGTGQTYGWLGLLVSNTVIADLAARKDDFQWNYLKGRDGKDFEHVYLRTKILTAPAISEDPISTPGFQDADHCPALDNSNNDFITSGANKNVEYTTFTDDPKGVSETWPYEWQARREKSNGTWQAFQEHAVLHSNWAEKGEKGDAQAYVDTEGVDNVVIDCTSDGKPKVARTATINASLYYGETEQSLSTSDSSVTVDVDGFTFGANIGTSCHFSISKGLDGCEVKLFIKTGNAISSGTITFNLVSNNGTHTATKVVNVIANKDGANGTNGTQGPKGDTGDTGPVLRYRGVYSSTTDNSGTDGYVWNNTFRDCVKNGSTYYLVNVDANGSTALGTPPNSKWMSAGSNLKFFATELLLAENATIQLLNSQKLIFTDADGNKTAGINEDGQGSHKTYYAETGRLRKDDNANGWTYYYDNDTDNTLLWSLGPDGVIVKYATVIKMEPISMSENPIRGASNFDGNTRFNIATRYIYCNENSTNNGKVYESQSLGTNNEPAASNQNVGQGTYATSDVCFQDIDSNVWWVPAVIVDSNNRIKKHIRYPIELG